MEQLKKDTAKIPEELLNTCTTPFERHMVLEMHDARVKRNDIVDVVHGLEERLTTTIKTVSDHGSLLIDFEKYKAVLEAKMKVWICVGGALWAMILIFLEPIASHFFK